jgi:CheY-like chemotaxis protein
MMLSSDRQPEDVARCERLQIASYLTKPVKQSELFDAIMVATGITVPVGPSAEPAPEERTSELRPLQVLLAEDSLVNQKLAVAMLRRWGHRVTLARNGREAVAAVSGRRFDLILMDVQMPEMDGLEATAAIRSQEKRTGTRTPIMAMTAHALKGDRERCLRAGMDGYVSKPIRSRELLHAMEALVGDADSTDASRDTPPPPDAGYTWTEHFASVTDHPELRALIKDSVTRETPHLLDSLRKAIASEDPDKLMLAAQTLNGSIRYFDAATAHDLAAQLEAIGRDGSVRGAAEILSALEQEMENLVAALRASL